MIRRGTVTDLFVKQADGEPMVAVPRLKLTEPDGVAGDINPAGISPRQVCIAIDQSLRSHEVSPAHSRANMIIRGFPESALNSGAIVKADNVALRLTIPCEPCAHGARLARAPMREFRQIARYLAVVLTGGFVVAGEELKLLADREAAVPGGFQARCAWAVSQIPPGRVVSSTEFLNAIGANRSYARVLPRWLGKAGLEGRPVHRVLTAGLSAPSWAPDALARLTDEGLPPGAAPRASYALTRTLWFSTQTALASIRNGRQAPARERKGGSMEMV